MAKSWRPLAQAFMQMQRPDRVAFGAGKADAGRHECHAGGQVVRLVFQASSPQFS